VPPLLAPQAQEPGERAGAQEQQRQQESSRVPCPAHSGQPVQAQRAAGVQPLPRPARKADGSRWREPTQAEEQRSARPDSATEQCAAAQARKVQAQTLARKPQPPERRTQGKQAQPWRV